MVTILIIANSFLVIIIIEEIITNFLQIVVIDKDSNLLINISQLIKSQHANFIMLDNYFGISNQMKVNFQEAEFITTIIIINVEIEKYSKLGFIVTMLSNLISTN